MLTIKTYERISSAERAAISDGILTTIAGMSQPRDKTRVIAACKRWASAASIILALKQLVAKGQVLAPRNPGGHHGMSPETRLYSVAADVAVPDGDPVARILECREAAANVPRERVRLYCDRMLRAGVRPSRQQITRDLKLSEYIVSNALKYLVSRELLDGDLFEESHEEVGLGEKDAEEVDRVTAQVLAEKLGMKAPPDDWREWRKRLRNRTVEVEWRPGWFVTGREME